MLHHVPTSVNSPMTFLDWDFCFLTLLKLFAHQQEIKRKQQKCKNDSFAGFLLNYYFCTLNILDILFLFHNAYLHK